MKQESCSTLKLDYSRLFCKYVTLSCAIYLCNIFLSSFLNISTSIHGSRVSKFLFTILIPSCMYVSPAGTTLLSFCRPSSIFALECKGMVSSVNMQRKILTTVKNETVIAHFASLSL